jgi:nucleotide-binding universal stress UspA family protein
MHGMFHKILIPLDFTEANEPAVRLALESAAGPGSEIVLLHVIETLYDVPFEEMRHFYDRLERRAKERLDAAAEPFRAAGLAVEQEVIFGRRVEQILGFARDKEVDLILLSSHRLGSGRPLASLGTISHQVAILATCPVLLVK